MSHLLSPIVLSITQLHAQCQDQHFSLRTPPPILLFQNIPSSPQFHRCIRLRCSIHWPGCSPYAILSSLSLGSTTLHPHRCIYPHASYVTDYWVCPWPPPSSGLQSPGGPVLCLFAPCHSPVFSEHDWPMVGTRKC